MLRSVLALAVVGAIAGCWYWLGRPLPLPPSPLGQSEKLGCVSYTPFHGDQTPFSEDQVITDRQIAEDMERLSRTTSCIRTYSAAKEHGRVAPIAGEHGLKVLQGIWLSRDLSTNRDEIELALALARNHPDVIEALIVGNETLLRGEMSIPKLEKYIGEVRQRSGKPVTYADVWEFWLEAPQLADAVDFVTIHILPYWEDDPVAADDVLAHVRDVRRRVTEAFPHKEIFIGEVGWPSAGRMRGHALPSPVNQARVLTGIVAAAKKEEWKANLIEAFDQPWKRRLEGTVGGHWGLYDSTRHLKFRFGEPLSDHPDWALKAALGTGAALLVFVAGWLGQRRRASSRGELLAVASVALAAGLTFGWAALNLTKENFFLGDQLRAVIMLGLALVVPMAVSFAVARGDQLAGFANALTASAWRRGDWTTPVLTLLFVATVVASLQVALGLVFDPRYKDFPVASLTAPVVALFILAFMRGNGPLRPGPAEIAAGLLLAGSSAFIVVNEGVANWEAGWLAVLLIVMALTTLRAKAAPG